MLGNVGNVFLTFSIILFGVSTLICGAQYNVSKDNYWRDVDLVLVTIEYWLVLFLFCTGYIIKRSSNNLHETTPENLTPNNEDAEISLKWILQRREKHEVLLKNISKASLILSVISVISVTVALLTYHDFNRSQLIVIIAYMLSFCMFCIGFVMKNNKVVFKVEIENDDPFSKRLIQGEEDYKKLLGKLANVLFTFSIALFGALTIYLFVVPVNVYDDSVFVTVGYWLVLFLFCIGYIIKKFADIPLETRHGDLYLNNENAEISFKHILRQRENFEVLLKNISKALWILSVILIIYVHRECS